MEYVLKMYEIALSSAWNFGCTVILLAVLSGAARKGVGLVVSAYNESQKNKEKK